MSSRETQVAKGTQKARQVNPKQYISKTNKNAAVVKKIGSTRTGGRIENPKNQPASTFALKRELNQASLTYVRDSDQLPVQDKKNNPGRYLVDTNTPKEKETNIHITLKAMLPKILEPTKDKSHL